MVTLPTPKVVTLTDIPQRTLSEWVSRRFVVPHIKGKRGRGYPDQYTITQVVGILVAVRLKNEPRDCVLSYVEKVVEAFTNVTEKWLQAKFDEGETHFVREHFGKVELVDPTYEIIDVQEIYKDVLNLTKGRVDVKTTDR